MIDQTQYLRGPRWFGTKGRNAPFRPGDVPLIKTVLTLFEIITPPIQGLIVLLKLEFYVYHCVFYRRLSCTLTQRCTGEQQITSHLPTLLSVDSGTISAQKIQKVSNVLWK